MFKNNDIEEFFLNNFDWEIIHKKCNLNEVHDRLWLYSRFYAIRFSNVIHMMEEGFFYESIFNLIVLLEQILASKLHQTDSSFQNLINASFEGKKKSSAHCLRELRNAMAHKYLFQYYVIIEGEEYPLDEMSNYAKIMQTVFLPIISCIDENYDDAVSLTIGKYTIEELAKQYGMEEELDQLLSANTNKKMTKTQINKVRKENEIQIMRMLNNSSPVSMLTKIFSSLF